MGRRAGPGGRAVCGRRRGHPRGARGHSRRGTPGPRLRGRRRRGRARVRGAQARRAGGRRRTPAAHRPLPQRAGVARPAALSAAQPDRHSARGGRARGRPCGPRGRRGAGAHAVLYAPAPGAADARRALLPCARRRAAAGPRPPRAGPRGSRRAAPGLGSGRRDELPDRRRRAGQAAGILAGGDQQPGRRRGPGLRLVDAARVCPADGAPQPVGGGPHPVHRRGIRLLRAVGPGGDRQQPHAAEEESRSPGARAEARRGEWSGVRRAGSRQ